MKLKFPNSVEYEFEYGKPIVVIGANGAGKTRFSVKIEELNDPAFANNNLDKSHIHRLSAQKSLTISNTIPIYDYESSERNLFLGNSESYASKKGYRYGSNPVTKLLDDYQQALSLLFAELQRELQIEHENAQKCVAEGNAIPVPKDTVVDRATRIWNTLLPHRTIDLSGNGVHVNYGGKKYHGKEMSDGERVMLYMICQTLVVRRNSLFIIDEPELHIHKALIKDLWTLLESERPDCIFMYITHDLDFATSRSDASVIWIQDYNGSNWQYEMLNGTDFEDLPKELLLEIIGTRQKILFVEGTKNSFDYQLYQEIYRDKGYHIIPCGGCQEVIRLVKAKRAYERLNTIEVYGIIDRDFRTENEINELKNDGIYCLEVAEVENLFVVPELLDIMESAMACNAGIAQKAKDFICDLFTKEKDSQIALALSQEMKHRLSLFDLGKQKLTPQEIKEKIDLLYSEQKITEFLDEKQKIFDVADTIEKKLAIFNFKGMSRIIGEVFGVKGNEYPLKVLNLLRNNHSEKEKILNAISKYAPELP